MSPSSCSLVCTMKGFHIVVVLSSAVLLVSAAPALELVTCSEDGGPAAARLAMHRINENHDHGYKFRFQTIQSHKMDKVDGGCNLELQLNLLETVCYNINPKPFEDCQLRGEAERAVMANCTVQISVRNNDANVTKYECDTRQVKTNQEMMKSCPDCPMLVPLDSVEGLKSVKEAVSKFNQNTTNQHYYILKEVGRIRVGHVLGSGMYYYTEFALVETHCLMGSRINPEACQPLCPDRAHHAFCQSSYANATGLKSVACEFYPPSNTTALGPGEKEPLCRYHGGGHPPHVGHGHGPPPPGSDPRTHSPCIPPPPGGDGHPPHVGHGHGPPPPGSDPRTHSPCIPPPPGGDGHPPHVGHGHGPPPPGSDPRTHSPCIPPPPGGDGHPPHVSHGHGPPPPGSDPRTHSPCIPPPPGGDGHPPRVGGGHGGRHHGGDGHHHGGDGQDDKEKHRPPFGSKHHFHPFHPFHPFHRCRGSDPALHPICPWPRLGHRLGHRPSHRHDD